VLTLLHIGRCLFFEAFLTLISSQITFIKKNIIRYYVLQLLHDLFRVDIGVDTKQQTLGSMAFPMERNVLQSLEEFLKKGHDYIQLSIGNVFLHYFQFKFVNNFSSLRSEKRINFVKEERNVYN